MTHLGTARIRRGRRPLAAISGCLVLFFGLFGASAGTAGVCGYNTPAFPVPEFKEGERLWPPNGFRPGNPGQRIPPDRDSSDYTSFGTFPTFRFGHELFQALDIIDDRLYVAYGAGFSVWDIGGAFVEDPDRLDVRDGELGNFLSFGVFGETDTYIYDIDAVDPTGGGIDDMIALAGEGETGFSLWENAPVGAQPSNLAQLYQDNGASGRAVRIHEYTSPVGTKTVYAFFGTDAGLAVYDASRARALGFPCLDESSTATIECSGVFRGLLDNQDKKVGYVDVVEIDSKLYIAIADGNSTQPGGNPLLLEIWEVANPAAPQFATLKFSGAGLNPNIFGIRGVELFEWNGINYLAFIENNTAKIYDVDACLDGNGCTTLGLPEWTAPLDSFPGQENFLTFSMSNGVPFLYYSLTADLLFGDKVEALFDLSTLGTTNLVQEITAGGGTYVETCANRTVDYWGSYYTRNSDGYQNVAPRHGKFQGGYFYRAARGILDVHVREEGVVNTPTLTTQVSSPPPYWFNDPIPFTATAQNCDGPEIWDWNASDILATGLGIDDQNNSITWLLCGGKTCPDKQIQVWAIKDACSGEPNLVENRVTITVSDPRPQVQSISILPTAVPATYPVCTELSFDAAVAGKPPINYSWEVRDSGGSVLNLPNTTQNPFLWNTSDISFPLPDLIFADGFETGDLSVWSTPVPQPGTEVYTVELTASNPGDPDMGSVQVTLEALDDLVFNSGTLAVTNLGDGQYRFVADTRGATEFRWEFEDPANGSTVGCEVFASCVIYDWNVEDGDVTYLWSTPNTDGNYGVAVWISQCDQYLTMPLASLPSLNQQAVVTGIIDPDPPVVTSFTVDTAASTPPCDCDIFGCTCPVGQFIDFDVTATGDPDVLEFDWDQNGTFESTVNFGDPIAHQFTSTGSKNTPVRAKKGSLTSATYFLDTSLLIIP